MSKSLHTPCCQARSGYKAIPLCGYADRTCTHCRRLWRYTFASGTWAELRELGHAQPSRVVGLIHGTREGYDKYGCRLTCCTTAKRIHNSRVYARRQAHLGVPLRVHAHCTYCERNLPHFATQRIRQRLWKQAHDAGVPWSVYQAACRAVFDAIAAWGKAHPPPLDLKLVAILARREKAVIYVIGRRCTTKRPPRGPFLEVWPSGNISAVGDNQAA
jgi:hypothetical protein